MKASLFMLFLGASVVVNAVAAYCLLHLEISHQKQLPKTNWITAAAAAIHSAFLMGLPIAMILVLFTRK